MNKKNIIVKNALISVSDKTGLEKFVKGLVECNVEIISTGGTSLCLRKAGIPVTDVASITGFPEIMDGRIKTLHPKIHGGILGLRDQHAETAIKNDIRWIDLVIVNLYPFAATIAKSGKTFDDAIENIDIGGPTMIRAAGKNFGWVGVVVDPNDYSNILNELQNTQTLSFSTREKLAVKAFTHTAEYDAIISNYLRVETNSEKNLPEPFLFSPATLKPLRYGENPHQAAWCYSQDNTMGVMNAQQLQGKELSFNNIADGDAALACLKEFEAPTCVIVKHANPCGVASDENIDQAFVNAWNADSQSAFGSIIALNRHCDVRLAEKIIENFIEVLIAPSFAEEALAIFSKKPNLRILILDNQPRNYPYEFKTVTGGFLIQEKDIKPLLIQDCEVKTKRQPTKTEWENMLFAWKVVKHIKSNAILIAKNNTTLGMGCGQVSRIDAVEAAIKKANQHAANAVLASDAFFPFRDSIERIAQTPIQAIIQPGGGMRDLDVVAACDEFNIAMVFTGRRCFKH